jgi:putative transcriptional regulator
MSKSDQKIAMDGVTETQADLSRHLRKAREEAGLTQDELADLASISNRPIYVFESGKGSIRLETYLKLLEALGLEMSIAPRKPRTERM